MRRKGSSAASGIMTVFFMVLMGLPGIVQADTGMIAEYYGQLEVDKRVLWGPGRLAVGGDGALYVADGYRNHVVKFGGNGMYLGDIAVARASAVGVGPDGTVYIGSHNDYSVAIIRGGKAAGYLGAGAGEFKSVTDIAVDGDTGDIYVADSAANTVKVYDAAGKALREIGGLHLPMAVAIAGSEVYIVNAPVQQAGTDEETTKAEVAVYDKAGRQVRSFGDSGLARPTDIAVSGGKAYITDAGKQAVLVYDAGGACLGEIQGEGGDLSAAVSLAVTGNGIIYVSANGTQGVQAFGITGR